MLALQTHEVKQQKGDYASRSSDSMEEYTRKKHTFLMKKFYIPVSVNFEYPKIKTSDSFSMLHQRNAFMSFWIYIVSSFKTYLRLSPNITEQAVFYKTSSAHSVKIRNLFSLTLTITITQKISTIVHIGR